MMSKFILDGLSETIITITGENVNIFLICHVIIIGSKLINWSSITSRICFYCLKKRFTDLRQVQEFKRKQLSLEVIGLSHKSTRPTFDLLSRVFRFNVQFNDFGFGETTLMP